MEPPAWAFQSPLHRGLGSDLIAWYADILKHYEFQSPLHRGLGSDFDGAGSILTFKSFNPLFIGAWVRTHGQGEVGMA